jgi:hypothetical protein
LVLIAAASIPINAFLACGSRDRLVFPTACFAGEWRAFVYIIAWRCQEGQNVSDEEVCLDTPNSPTKMFTIRAFSVIYSPSYRPSVPPSARRRNSSNQNVFRILFLTSPLVLLKTEQAWLWLGKRPCEPKPLGMMEMPFITTLSFPINTLRCRLYILFVLNPL